MRVEQVMPVRGGLLLGDPPEKVTPVASIDVLISTVDDFGDLLVVAPLPAGRLVKNAEGRTELETMLLYCSYSTVGIRLCQN